MSALLSHVALISQSPAVTFGQTAKIASALQKQVTRDFAPIWEIDATVDAFETIDDVPTGYWPIMIRDDIQEKDAAGFHKDESGQPFALVLASEGTPLTCSHELLEMLADPFGSRLVASDSIKTGQARVNYLVEVCDPSESAEFGYEVNGIQVSDFYTPHFFDPVRASGVRYSYTGSIQGPKQVLKGGYLSWQDPTTSEWWQATYFNEAMSIDGPFTMKRDPGKSWRETIDARTPQPLARLQGASLAASKTVSATGFFAASVTASSNAWARNLMRQVQALVK